ncbi:DUF3578 domain-containing protein [Cupriavidus necator H16]|uniref:DUF3578 domain-containing protein n=1 Tax=Cupriavidus necator (strain ATCC 17699 / DSM 428 / KCTC 22496 / NCIMB 10442 / H16 / Stanier 337) TaxID=381666 RepID=Q0KFQ5_CUPNH|nr:DUF3578 domain-containing protein [Cupriavidus necator]QCB99140.1 DUF3578 domain-containing protein [Cupriavidus necator H16]QQB78044.1 DUF3578 domain-containing protein [Cupriavidus necator]WKA40962.1 DUF3578 domain-containing protein [Cupriavidus necator]CAJ91166.1 predicted restriction endonuclease [Cupriavidus necator H16]
MQSLSVVMENYLATKSALSGKARNANTPDQISISKTLPQFFIDILERLERRGAFKVEGSYGQGNIAGVPWIGVFNLEITTSAQNGYYIVLLFSEDMKSCYLSLNQGVTTLKNAYGVEVALHKLRGAAELALEAFVPAAGTVKGPIDLKASRALGKGYERGAIESFRYDFSALPTPDSLELDFRSLLGHYDTLANKVGPSLQALVPVNETQFQKAVLEKATATTKKDCPPFVEPPGGVPVLPKRGNGGSWKYPRDPLVAAEAVKSAEYRCELFPEHQTFKSSSKNVPYVEAHHLIPLSRQADFQFSLDITANIIALCPTCHQRLHHGHASERRSPLRRLLSQRKDRLQEKQIFIEEEILLHIYSNDILDNED